MARERVGEGWLVLESRGVMDVLEHDPQPALDPFVVGPQWAISSRASAR